MAAFTIKNYLTVISQMCDRRLWTQEEDRLICQLVRRHGCKKWTEIAAEMKQTRGMPTRSSKQIRQRWYNHLDPAINKCHWTIEQERVIFEAHQKYGSKWKHIAQLLSARTDNSVKNHFYSTLRRSLRRINKVLGFKNSTNQMRTLKPSILSYLVDSTDQESRMLVEKVFQFATYKPCKAEPDSVSMTYQEKQTFEKVIQQLIEINVNYQKIKNTQKIIKNKRVKVKSCPKQQRSESNTFTIDDDYKQAMEVQSTADKQSSTYPIKTGEECLPQEHCSSLEQFDFWQAEEEHYLQEIGEDQKDRIWFQIGNRDEAIDEVDLNIASNL